MNGFSLERECGKIWQKCGHLDKFQSIQFTFINLTVQKMWFCFWFATFLFPCGHSDLEFLSKYDAITFHLFLIWVHSCITLISYKNSMGVNEKQLENPQAIQSVFWTRQLTLKSIFLLNKLINQHCISTLKDYNRAKAQVSYFLSIPSSLHKWCCNRSWAQLMIHFSFIVPCHCVLIVDKSQ